MDEKTKKIFADIYASLTDEQKEKAKECKTMEEMMEFAGKEGFELPDEVLDTVAGGEPLLDACRDNEGCGDKSISDFFC